MPHPPGNLKSLDKIDDILKKLGIAKIAFNTPETMKVNETRNVNLLLSKELLRTEIRQKIKSISQKQDTIIDDSIRISTTMEAFLTGQDFSIIAITPVRQYLDIGGENVWKWEVKATSVGKEKKLYLTLNAVVYDGKERELHTLRTYERTIIVYVNFADKAKAFFAGNWQWLFAVIVSPLMVFIWNKIKDQKKYLFKPEKDKENKTMLVDNGE